tara:strand:+ start:4594 stop:4830 length:237 start_codon:yes stop_codon:yes gene_type:complete
MRKEVWVLFVLVGGLVFIGSVDAMSPCYRQSFDLSATTLFLEEECGQICANAGLNFHELETLEVGCDSGCVVGEGRCA